MEGRLIKYDSYEQKMDETIISRRVGASALEHKCADCFAYDNGCTYAERMHCCPIRNLDESSYFTKQPGFGNEDVPLHWKPKWLKRHNLAACANCKDITCLLMKEEELERQQRRMYGADTVGQQELFI